MPSVQVKGDGVAASFCAHLLGRAGLSVGVESGSRSGAPAILLSDSSVELMRDVLGRAELFRDAVRIRKRSVLWGAQDSPLELPHSAVVVSQAALVEGIGSAGEEVGGQAEWTILARGPLPDAGAGQCFGSRMAVACAVDMRDPRDSEACWIESVPRGWMFLVAGNTGRGWLLTVGGLADEMLCESRLIAQRIARCDSVEGQFPSSPRLAEKITGAGWLACGTGAMSFDPLCGDGTAHAVREAILASAVIRAALAGGDQGALRKHYEMRLAAGFRKHLELCAAFYESGGVSDWWTSQAAETRRGLDWCERRFPRGANFEYRLNGFELERVV